MYDDLLLFSMLGDLLFKSLPVITLLIGIYKFYKQNQVNKILLEEKLKAASELKRQEQQINEILEQQKFDHQKQLTEYGLYAAKKHEKYIELYEKLSEAVNFAGVISSLFRSITAFTDYNEEDVNHFLSLLGITQGKKEEVLNTWRRDKNEGIRELRKLNHLYENVTAVNNVAKARRAYIEAKLYLSEGLSEIIDQYIMELDAFTGEIEQEVRIFEENHCAMNPTRMKERPAKMKEFLDRFNEITGKLRDDLRQ